MEEDKKNLEGAQTPNPESTQPEIPAAAPRDDKMVTVPESALLKIQEDLAAAEKRDVDRDLQIKGLEELISNSKEGSDDKDAIRKRKTYEPKFRTVRIRKYPMAGDIEKLGYVIGWTSRGAYQKVDRTGVSPQVVDYLDIIFLGHERNGEGKLQAESVPLLDLLNRGQQVHCKIISKNVTPQEVPTGEEIDVTTWDPQHGLVATGDKVDGYVEYSDIKYVIDVPGHGQVTIDDKFVN